MLKCSFNRENSYENMKDNCDNRQEWNYEDDGKQGEPENIHLSNDCGDEGIIWELTEEEDGTFSFVPKLDPNVKPAGTHDIFYGCSEESPNVDIEGELTEEEDGTFSFVPKLDPKVKSAGTHDIFYGCSEESPNVDIEESANMKKYVRKRKKCPVCQKIFVHLRPHLSKMHGMEEDAITAITKLLRSRIDHGKQGKKCPFPECSGLLGYKCLDKHLQHQHYLKRDDPIYQKYINARFPFGVRGRQSVTEKYSAFSNIATKKFHSYLFTLDGGSMNDEAANQLRLHVRQVINGMGATSYHQMISDEAIVKMQNWFVEYSKTHEASSSVTYLSTMISFYKYLLQLKIGGFNYEKFDTLKNRLNKWKASFRKLKMGKLSFDIPDITPADINLIHNSALIKDAKAIFNLLDLQQKFDFSPYEHSNCRSALIMLSVLRNSCRSCALYNMQLEEFIKAEKIENGEDNYFVIKVQNHKTVSEHGPAEVVLDAELYKLYGVYKDCMRYKILEKSNQKSSFFFLTWSAKNLKSDDVYKGLINIWTRSGLSSKIGTNIIRKLVTSEVHDNRQELIPNIARHLKHKASTAERNYKLLKRSVVSVETSIQIDKILRGIPSQNLQNTSSEPSTSRVVTESSTSQISTESPTCWINKPKIVQRQKGRPFFSVEERKQIERTFHSFISRGEVPKLKTIRDMTVEDPVIRDWSESKQNSTKIKGCLQNFKNKFNKPEKEIDDIFA